MSSTRPYTVAQLAARWQCAAESIYALIRKHERGEPGGLPAFTIGGKLLRIKAEVVDQWEGSGGSTASDATASDASSTRASGSMKPLSVGEMSKASTERDSVSTVRSRVERRLMRGSAASRL